MNISRDEFQKLYCDEKLQIKEIAALYGCCKDTVTAWRKKFGIPKQPPVRCKDMVGQVFGKWTVLAKCQYKHKVKWRCRCSCGNESEISRTSLVRHTSSKCRKCGYISNRFLEPVPRYYWAKVLIGAKKRELEVKVTQEFCRDLYLEQQGKCAYTGLLLYWARNVKEFKAGLNTASLDRIDSSKGYLEDNVQWVHKVINNMKQDLTPKEFHEWCRRVVDYGKVCLE